MRSINPRDYYHPQDQKALWELQQIPGFSAALKAFMKMFSENMIRGINMSNKVQIGPGSCRNFMHCCRPSVKYWVSGNLNFIWNWIRQPTHIPWVTVLSL